MNRRFEPEEFALKCSNQLAHATYLEILLVYQILADCCTCQSAASFLLDNCSSCSFECEPSAFCLLPGQGESRQPL